MAGFRQIIDEWITDNFTCVNSAAKEALIRRLDGEVNQRTFVQPVPDHCDRILWRKHYYQLPSMTVEEQKHKANNSNENTN